MTVNSVPVKCPVCGFKECDVLGKVGEGDKTEINYKCLARGKRHNFFLPASNNNHWKKFFPGA